MTVEDVLTRALNAEAEARDVDLPALHRDVLGRLPELPRRRRRPLLVAAAAAGALVTGTAVTALFSSGDDSTIYGDDANGRVATQFTCPQVNDIDFATTEDDGFLPDLSDGQSPAEVARLEHAPTFEFTTAGDTATLRLGNADGSLGSVTTYALVGGVWIMRTARVCAGAGDLPFAPVGAAMRLGEHGAAPWPAKRFNFGVNGVPAGFVDDRPYYNLAGVIEGHRSMYVEPCRRGGWCWVSGEPDSFLLPDRIPPSSTSGQPHDVSALLVNPDMMVGRENPYGLWAYDVNEPGDFSAVLRDGTVVPAKEVTQPEWGGRRVLVVLAYRAEVVTLQFTAAGGEVATWEPGELDE
jgi:hypothetical protein